MAISCARMDAYSANQHYYCLPKPSHRSVKHKSFQSEVVIGRYTFVGRGRINIFIVQKSSHKLQTCCVWGWSQFCERHVHTPWLEFRFWVTLSKWYQGITQKSALPLLILSYLLYLFVVLLSFRRSTSVLP